MQTKAPIDFHDVDKTNVKDWIEALREKYENDREVFKADYKLYAETEIDFQERLSNIIKEKKKTSKGVPITQEYIAEQVGISPTTLSNYKKNKGPSFNVLVAICIAMELDMKQSASLFSSLGYSFLGTSREQYAYAYLIENHRGKTVAECNNILVALDIGVEYLLYPNRNQDKAKMAKNLAFLPKPKKNAKG